MAVAIAPATARIAALNLAVTMRERDATRIVNRKGGLGPDVSEHWAGSIAFARLNRADGAALVAFFESLGGRELPFLISLKYGFATSGPTATGVVSTAAADTIIATGIAAGTAIPAGSLVAIGDPHAAEYQVCEVLDDATVGASVTLAVAPRLRRAYAAGTAVAVGTVYGKFNLASDDLSGFAADVSATGLSINVVEAIR